MTISGSTERVGSGVLYRASAVLVADFLPNLVLELARDVALEFARALDLERQFSA